MFYLNNLINNISKSTVFFSKKASNYILINQLIISRANHGYCFSDGNEPDKLYKTIDLEIKGHDLSVMSSYEKFIEMTAKELQVNIQDSWTPPRVFERWTLLKSVHIYKKHRVQYEARTNYRILQLSKLTGSTADTFLEYIERNLPEGMALKVIRRAIEPLPTHIEATKEIVPYQHITINRKQREKQYINIRKGKLIMHHPNKK